MKQFLSVVFFTVIFSTMAFPQTEEGQMSSVGLSVSWMVSQTDIMVPIRLTDNAVIIPALGLTSIKKGGTNIDFGFSQRFYFSHYTISPYAGFRGGIIASIPTTGKSIIDYMVGIMGGGEYFLSPKFSVGVETQLNWGIASDKSTRFGVPGGQVLTTGNAIFATIYF